MKLRSLLAVVFVAVFLGLFASPVASQRLPRVTLPDEPVVFNTLDQAQIREAALLRIEPVTSQPPAF